MKAITYILAIALALLTMVAPSDSATLADWLMWAGSIAVVLYALNLATDNNKQ